MAKPFDPYHKWLGISPKEQPPNHYRLLGIELFEGDPDVIEAAADQRMAHVRTYQTGQNSELSQKILNELSAAKLCLLNEGKKVAYDAELRQRISATKVVHQTAARHIPVPVPYPIETPPPISILTEPQRHKSSNSTAAIMIAAALIALLSLAGLWYANSGKRVQQRDAIAHDNRDSSNQSATVRSDTDGSQPPKQPSPSATASKKSGRARSETAGENVTTEDVRVPSSLEQPPAGDKSELRPSAAEKIDDHSEKPTAVKPDPSRSSPSADKIEPNDKSATDNPDTSSQKDRDSIAASKEADRELPPFRPKGNWLDALKSVDPLEHLVQGDWVRGRKDLQVIAGASSAMIEIPVEAEGSYDVQVQFARVQGDGALAIVFPVGSERGQFWLSSADDKVGLSRAEGAEPTDAETEMPPVLSNNHRYALELQVRVLDADFAAIEVLVDKKKRFGWRGSPAKLQLALDPPVPAGIRFGILCGRATSAAVHAIRVRAMSAETAPQGRISLKPKGSIVKLRIAGRIDGRDRCQIYGDHAQWTHETWGWPAKVKLCDVEWSPQGQRSMPLEPRLRNALAKVDFRSAQLAKISGRGEIRLERSEVKIVIVLDDDAAGFGADDYEAVVTLLRDK